MGNGRLFKKGQYDLLDRTQTVRLYDQTSKELTNLKAKLAADQKLVSDYTAQLAKSTAGLNQLKRQQGNLQTQKDQLQAKILTTTEMIGKLQNRQSVSSIKREQQLQERERLTNQLQELNMSRTSPAGISSWHSCSDNSVTVSLTCRPVVRSD